MLMKTKGISINMRDYLVGRVTRDPMKVDGDSFLICENEAPSIIANNFLGVLSTSNNKGQFGSLPTVCNVPAFEHLKEGDIVVASSDGNINTLYRVDSFHNTILATERCNSNCLMCSQPPRDKNDIPYLYELYRRVIPLIPKDCVELTITGGEPTLMGELFFQLLDQITSELPDTEIHVLTNG